MEATNQQKYKKLFQGYRKYHFILDKPVDCMGETIRSSMVVAKNFDDAFRIVSNTYNLHPLDFRLVITGEDEFLIQTKQNQ